MANELPVYLFHQGTNYSAQKFLGAHPLRGGGFVFRVWAPNAKSAAVIGDFCSWDYASATPMRMVSEGGVYEARVRGAKAGMTYKFLIETADGRMLLKADPYAFYSETDGATASLLYTLPKYNWGDGAWIKHRKKAGKFGGPLNIYEVHLGSWRRDENGRPFDYRRAAHELCAYASEMGYTHIELLPVCEHPYEGSWGYQVTGYFAPTSRYGTPEDFMAFVDICHQYGMGVILDWVPGHFPKDGHGLYEFDGQPLYECQGADRQEHRGWGTRMFDFGRPEVQSFLVSGALHWLNTYHIDGLRVDAVASMLYLDYGKQPGEWSPNPDGTRINREAEAFLKKLNLAVSELAPHALMIAEESTSYEGVTTPVQFGGLGFDYKWNMGWMNDVLDYMQTDPIHRGAVHGKLTFSLMYAFSENFVLPISHDEVVHGKKSLLDKMPGDYLQKFASLRTFLAFMAAHPGKKLTFMGCEFGQFIEWDYRKQLDWLLLDYEMHAKTQLFCKELWNFYLQTPALWQDERSWQGFSWIAADEAEKNVIAFVRRDNEANELVAVFNFSGLKHKGFRLGVKPGQYDMALCTDSQIYGGSAASGGNGGARARYTAKNIPAHGSDFSISLDLQPLSACFLKKSGIAPVTVKE